MAVKKELRGKGIGNQLVQFTIDFCKQEKIKSIILYSNTVLNNSITLYKKYGFKELKNPKRVIKEGQFTCRQEIKDTVPEFYFWDKIVETRLGFHEEEPKERIEKLKNHTGVIILLTADGEKVLTSGETTVLRIPFHQFVKESKTLLGIKLRHTEAQSLSNKLKRKLFWN